ncbi:hydroxymethylpyrimidine/phosphomethylpyrimidine kinase [Spirosoma rhododendri]|uniref:hydroxymethylpyrimidine kinase n=1 Tax=Spirosoma rhododendri TaxID=2728024 RepID=A0A7L5DWS4_9BACT|nr:hydroxymethylpyrimidine/phosphomethylpyrimidine kinase [Spirosoma rhododendri]QJD80000.1 hydroxymethylpyrimidine/phosphomethylpyrimidine kinase [Spirosoma rhododendri]
MPEMPPIQTERPYALSIAGLDPSAGAGLLADVKTLEACGVYGLGVCTALTMQHDSDFRAVDWVPLDRIIAQCEPLFERYPIDVVKIGLIESLDVLANLLDWLQGIAPGVSIIWDPILKASAGFSFHQIDGRSPVLPLLARLSLLTPNAPEAVQLAGTDQPWAAAEQLSAYCPVYLKGGHLPTHDGQVADYLLVDGYGTTSFPAFFIANGEKHGSGCVLSAAVAAGLARGLPLPDACRTARRYMNQYLASSPTRLGFHSTIA